MPVAGAIPNNELSINYGRSALDNFDSFCRSQGLTRCAPRQNKEKKHNLEIQRYTVIDSEILLKK